MSSGGSRSTRRHCFADEADGDEKTVAQEHVIDVRVSKQRFRSNRHGNCPGVRWVGLSQRFDSGVCDGRGRTDPGESQRCE